MWRGWPGSFLPAGRSAPALLVADGFRVVGDAIDGAEAIARWSDPPTVVLTSFRDVIAASWPFSPSSAPTLEPLASVRLPRHRQ